jgi:antitoxin HigA-1
MNVPGWRLHPLHGGLAGHWSVWVSGNGRLTFGSKTALRSWSTTATTTEEPAMTRMHNPPHPGLTLRDDVLPALGLSVTEAANQLGVTRAALSRILNGRAAISPIMALRLERWLGVERGGRAALWLAQQSAFDLWHAEQAMKPLLAKVKRAADEPAER